MRKITLFTTLLLASFAGSAQITYESSDFATAGEEFTITQATGFIGMNFAVTGAGQNWNYSQLDAQSQATTGYQNPNNAGYKLSWCLSHFYLFTCNSQFNNNFSLSQQLSEGFEIGGYGIGNVVAHSNVTASVFETKMLGLTATANGLSIPMAVDYDDPDEVLHFPIVFGDNYTTQGHFNMDLSDLGVAFEYAIDTERAVSIQGWGALTTPYATFPNVLKVKTILERTDTVVYEGFSLPLATTTVSYQWFDKEYGVPVLQADGMEVFGLFIPVSVRYLDGPQCLDANALFAYLPTADYNPETQSGNVAFTNLSQNYDQAVWDFGDGNTSTEATPAHAYDCPGTHQVTLTVTNTACQPNSTATFSLPVVVTDSGNALTTSVTVSEGVLTADRDLAGTTYQWMDCDTNTAIAEQTGQSFTPSVSGNYSVTLNTNGCEGASECVALTVLGSTHFNQETVQLYPNPTTGILQLTDVSLLVKRIAIYNSLGMLVGDKLDLSGQATGMYFVAIDTDRGSIIKKVLKE